MSPTPKGFVQSVQARLLNHARSVGADPNTVLARYGLERFLHRLGRSKHAELDGVSYAPDSVRVAPIRVEDECGGQRIRLRGLLGKAQLALQIDVGIGDAVTPEPEWIDYPSLLDLPRPRLRAYRPETTIAEKLHAMAILGMANS